MRSHFQLAVSSFNRWPLTFVATLVLGSVYSLCFVSSLGLFSAPASAADKAKQKSFRDPAPPKVHDPSGKPAPAPKPHPDVT